MNKTYFFVGLCLLLLGFFAGWAIAVFTGLQDESYGVAQAIPVIRDEHFDASRNALIISLFNPGGTTMEIDRIELTSQFSSNHPEFVVNTQDYDNQPLVLDPSDTILIPFKRSLRLRSQTEKARLWGKLEFRVRGRDDFYSLRHRFNNVL